MPFPEDDYTPHGYLQNRFDAGPFAGLDGGGVLRSLPGVGVEWQPGSGPYGGLRLGVQIGDRLLLDEWDGAGLVAPYHSCHIRRYEFSHAGVSVYCTVWLAARGRLACHVEAYRPVGRYRPPRVRLVALAVTRWPGQAHGWCYAGGRHDAGSGAVAVSLERGPW